MHLYVDKWVFHRKSSKFMCVCGKLSTVKIMALTVSQLAQVWDRALAKIKDGIADKITYESFFTESYIYSLDGNVITVVVNSDLAASVISTKYESLVDEVLREVTGLSFTVNFVAPDKVQSKPVSSAPEKQPFFSDSRIDPSYTFDTFVVGTSNREAYQAAVLAAKDPGKFYNPVLIFGDSGLGKTHLLHAIGNTIKESKPGMRVLYVKAQDFLDEYIKYVKNDSNGVGLVEWFKASVDVLLVDDVQFLANKTKTEETFFSIYNYLYSAGKQVVITSDKHPSLLNGLDDRLKTRFVQGLPISIERPEKTVCELILRKRIEQKGMTIEDFDPEVITYFASKFGSNVRELEGAFDRMFFYITNFKNVDHIDLSTAIESVRSLVNVKEDEDTLSQDKIISTVAEYYGLTLTQITGTSRQANIALARHISMFLIRVLLDAPFKKIGDRFGGKDHTTVMNAVEKIEKASKTDEQLKKAIEELKKRING